MHTKEKPLQSDPFDWLNLSHLSRLGYLLVSSKGVFRNTWGEGWAKWGGGAKSFELPKGEGGGGPKSFLYRRGGSEKVWQIDGMV